MIPMTMFIKRQCKREWLLQVRQPRFLFNTLLFFLMIIFFFPLSMPANASLLKQIAPGLIWMAALLALLLSAERIFQQDSDEGVTEQWLTSGYPLSVIVWIKVLIHCATQLIPMLLLTPVIALLFSFHWLEMLYLILSLMAGTPAIAFLCALAAAFGIGLQQKGIMMALVILPLALPVMIFGSATLTAVLDGLNPEPYLALLIAISLLCLGLLPFAIAAVIKASHSG